MAKMDIMLSTRFQCQQPTPGLAGGRRRRHGRLRIVYTQMHTYEYSQVHAFVVSNSLHTEARFLRYFDR